MVFRVGIVPSAVPLGVEQRSLGVYIRFVDAGSQAAIAGLQSGDVLVEIGDRVIHDSVEASTEIEAGVQAAKCDPLSVYRDGIVRTLRCIRGPLPDPSASHLRQLFDEADRAAPIALVIFNVNAEVRARLGVRESELIELRREHSELARKISHNGDVHRVCITPVRPPSGREVSHSEECGDAKLLHAWNPEPSVSYTIIISGIEERVRHFFRTEDALSLRVESLALNTAESGPFVLRSARLSSSCSTTARSEFDVKPGDYVGEEKFTISGAERGCLLLAKGDRSIRLCTTAVQCDPDEALGSFIRSHR